MDSIYNELLDLIYDMKCQTALDPKTIKVSPSFYKYLEAIHKRNKFLREYEGNTVSFIMGIPVVVDDTMVGKYYSVEFEELTNMKSNAEYSYEYSNSLKSKLLSNTIEIGIGMPKTKSHLKVGNLVIHNTHHFNWIERKMWKLLLGFDIENVED